MRPPTIVSLIGRPNVGKSSLFNALTDKGFESITGDRPGVTRDCNYGLIGDTSMIIIDTGGFYSRLLKEEGRQEYYFNLMAQHAKKAVKESDIVLLVLDVREGLLPFDYEITDYLRSQKKEFWAILNKYDSYKQEGCEMDFYSLGVKKENMFFVSAAHRRGLETLKDRLFCEWGKTQNQTSPLGQEVLPQKENDAVKVALIGTPNAGKSTLLNRLLGTPRALVSEYPGTTVDSLSGYFNIDSTLIHLIDTAGIRKKRLITDWTEEESVVHSLAGMRESDIVVYLIDIKKGVARQDRRLIEIALSKGKSVVVCLNKTDLIPKEERKEKEDWIEELPCLRFCDVVYLSAETGYGVPWLLKSLEKTIAIRRQNISTGRFNRVLQELVGRCPISVDKLHGRPLKVKYAFQVKNAPPTFLLYVNHVRGIPENYRRYLKKGLQKHFGLDNTPIHLVFRHQTTSPVDNVAGH